MKKFISRFSGVAPVFFPKALAALNTPTTPNGLASSTDLVGTITTIITKVLDFVLILAIAFVVYAGIRLIISGGDDAAKETAKKTIIYVIVGIIVILLARVIVVFVNNWF
ncbi:hypothetical protein A3A67_00520 [Candidatus Peribacteria bacterium RIFCSPLOWO2_01_FULL_51_18]|nr:MAG: hypothetical protein A3C52_05025 [Candidatus Peribacteria bacterium RIFCSPHIGHO2_02_FULL_51_15]OGJ64947.1 MAG: hypothetical protein A3A67_00520 [Candidatus Peribacteria bacterium RIFCSPLOWO2_01_FULL_51_18]OGJ68419.1 MAG: hypothetical protein A3J34_03485 [Candidatus Peribacteria bacterium RIFCSPLOWO2_02_FULL_51_10]